MSERAEWTEGRREAARVHAEALARAAATEAAAAGRVLAEFAATALAQGIKVQRLVARSDKGTGRYPTTVTGWYLRRDSSLGVDTEGGFYELRVAGGMLARFRPTELTPKPPPLVIGRGGRDGDVIDLKDLVALRLAAGDDWPTP